MEFAGFTTDLVMLAFTTPFYNDCLANYTITTNANAPSFTTDNIINITKPGNDLATTTYMVTVSAVDFAGRIGPPYSLDCFMFSGENNMYIIILFAYMYIHLYITLNLIQFCVGELHGDHTCILN